MSASSKKKLRKEQNAAVLTEKQRQEQVEAKKLKAYSITFIAIMLVVVITAASVMGVTAFNRTGILQKNTIAATIGDHEINTVELTYYFNDIINNTYYDWYENYGNNTDAVLSLMGLDVLTPLDEQEHPEGNGTWADYFLNSALERAKSDYALYEKAIAEKFTLSEDDQKSIDTNIATLQLYSQLNGHSDLDGYLQALYCFGASEESYREYNERSTIASAYYSQYYDSLNYDETAIREYEKDKYDNYSSFTYASYYLNCNSFLTGGTKDEKGSTTYSDAEKEAAREAAKAAADSLTTVTNVEGLDKAIAALAINAENEEAASTKSDSLLYSSVDPAIRDWLTDDGRVANDITVIPYESTSTDADGKETKTINGYYVVLFQKRNDNTRALANVRHLLVKFEKDDEGNVSDEAKAAAKKEAEGYLKTWQDGEATEESFVELVKKNSDDSSASAGGLFEDITLEKNVYVEPFYNWCVDESRKAGDAEVIETEFGYHVMYYVGDDELTYRDYMITNDMRYEDTEKWYNAIVEPVTITEGNFSRLDTSVILSAS